jgi:hypothetical protein
MPKGDPHSAHLNEDADAIEQKYGPFAEVYADSRPEAAEMAGNGPGKERERIAAIARDGD